MFLDSVISSLKQKMYSINAKVKEIGSLSDMEKSLEIKKAEEIIT